MTPENLNNLLRSMIESLVQAGWQKTKISKVLLGVNGQAQMNRRFMNVDDSDEKLSDFGIKPLTKIAKLLDNNLYLVIANPDTDANLISAVEDQNIKFAVTLKEAIEGCLSNNSKSSNFGRKVTSAKIDEVLEEMLKEG